MSPAHQPPDRSRPRHALILVEDLPVPFDRRVWSEAKTLREAGWRVTVVSPRGEFARRVHETVDGIEIYRYPLPTTAPGTLNHVLEYSVAMPASAALSMVVRLRGRVDVVHACNPPDFFFPIGSVAKRLGAAFIFDQHDLAPEVHLAQGGRAGGPLARFLRWAERRTYRSADIVIATNESYRRIAIERGGRRPEDVFVVRSSPDPSRIHRVEPDPALRRGRRFLVAYLGTMGAQDGVDIFVRMAREIEDAAPGQVAFVAIGGGGEFESLQQLRDGLGLSDVVRFTGRIPDHEVRTLLSTADVGISPDPQNGFNEFCTMNKTLEYMAMGLPLVAFDLIETRASADDAALYAPPNDSGELVRLVRGLLDDPACREQMGRIGQKRISGPLSWSASARQLLLAYEAALERRTRR